MKLFIHNTDGAIIIGQDGDPTPSGYTDTTNLLEVATNANLYQRIEYNKLRWWVSSLFVAKGVDIPSAFTACTTAEKIQVSRFILMPYSARLSVLSDEQDSINWNLLVKRSEGSPSYTYEGRSRVYEDLRVCVSDYVRREVWILGNYYTNLSEAQELFRDVSTYKDWYIGSNDPMFHDFLSSTGQFDATTGMKSKGYWLQALEDDLLAIYNAG